MSRFTWKTIKEDYYNPIYNNKFRSVETEIEEIFEREGATEENKHDLWKCLLNTWEGVFLPSYFSLSSKSSFCGTVSIVLNVRDLIA